MKSQRILFALALLPSAAFAQNAPAAPKNLIYNGGFESFYQYENYWDGVDSDGYLAGQRGRAKAISERGTLESMPMPVSVQLADMNGDGLLDLITADGDDYLRVYFNSGSKTGPKFTNAEVIPVYLSRSYDDAALRHTLRIGAYDLGRSGAIDLIIGNYGGEISLLRNSGRGNAPDFRQPKNVEELLIPTTKTGNLWGNLFSPVLWDWDRDGKPDLLVGEGSYSANTVHLLLNQGSAASLKFSEDAHHYLAYGDGREQLTPAVVDYNGDGHPDLLVGDRLGNVNVYLNDGAWTREKELKFSSTITFGSISKFNFPITLTAGDLNGDGLFDLVIGKTNGRLALATNKGTREQPKFDSPVEIKGVDVWNRGTSRKPSDWSIDFGMTKGNFYGITSIVGADDPDAAPIPEGKNVFKASYLPPLNKVFRYHPAPIPITVDNETAKKNLGAFQRNLAEADTVSRLTPSNMLLIRKILDRGQLKPGKNYTLTFKVKGRGASAGELYVALEGSATLGESKIISRNERGAVKRSQNRVDEWQMVQKQVNVGQNWTQVSQPLSFTFTHKELNNPDSGQGAAKPVYRGVLEFRVILAPGAGACLLDDFHLVER